MATLAPSLAAFRSEANARYPNRDKSSDGWIGDTAHSTRPSDHNPGARDLVHAYDLDEDLDGNGTDAGAELQWMVNHIVARRDRRVSYLIYEGRMWRSYPTSSVPAWAPAPYSGTNAHRKHLHVSILSTVTAEQDTGPWLIAGEDIMTPAQEAKLDRVLASLGRVENQHVPAMTTDVNEAALRAVHHLTTGRENQLFAGQVPDDLHSWIRDPDTITLPRLLAAVRTADVDIPVAEIVQKILATLTPEAIAAAIPAVQAQAVAVELGARLSRPVT